MTREEILDCVLDTEFGLEWNTEKGKEFRKAIVDLSSVNNFCEIGQYVDEPTPRIYNSENYNFMEDKQYENYF